MKLSEMDTTRNGSGALPRNAYHPNPSVQATPAVPAASPATASAGRQVPGSRRQAAPAPAPAPAQRPVDPRRAQLQGSAPTMAQLDQRRAAAGHTGSIPRGMIQRNMK